MVRIRSFQPKDAEAVRALFARGQRDFAQGREEVIEDAR